MPPAPLLPGTASRCRARGARTPSPGCTPLPRPWGHHLCTLRARRGHFGGSHQNCAASLLHMQAKAPAAARGGVIIVPACKFELLSTHARGGSVHHCLSSPLPPSSDPAQGCRWGTPIARSWCWPRPRLEVMLVLGQEQPGLPRWRHLLCAQALPSVLLQQGQSLCWAKRGAVT